MNSQASGAVLSTVAPFALRTGCAALDGTDGSMDAGGDMGRPTTGSLLLAGVGIIDGIFDQSVVLMLDVDDEGALGVVLNRVSEIELGSVLPQWSDLTSEPHVLFDGGQVSRNGAVCLAVPTDETEEPAGWRRLFGNVGLLHLDTPVELVADAFKYLRIFAGYAGWSPGQLEGELARGSWHVATALDTDAFDADPGTLWRRTMHRQSGDVAIFATWPADPEAN